MRKKKSDNIVYNDYNKYLDAELISLIKSKLGDDSESVLNEMTDIIKLESNMPPMLDNGKTYGDWNLPALSMYYTGDYRPSDALPLDVINQMLKSSPVRFALEMKRAQVVSVWRNSRSWDIVSPDTELAEVVKANLQSILPKMSLDFSFSSMAYGASFQELVWEYKSKYELGISEDDSENTTTTPPADSKEKKLEDKKNSSKKFIVAKIPNSVNPATIVRINRKKDGSFDGFVQQAKTLNAEEVVVPREASLVIPYEEKFRNLWGESLLKPMYPIWFWYEVVLRAMVKYMERTGTPVALVKAPSRATIIKPGTKTKVDGITWGMEIASNVARSNAAVIPSDTDDSGKPLWDLQYLNSTERSQPFLDILELLTQMILRAGLSADRALSQSSGGTGSYAIGKVHQEATSLHNEMVLIQWVHYLNTYFLPLYSLYNRGQNGPPIWMETQGLDPMDRENLVALLGIAQGMPAFQEVGYKIDWEAIFATNNIPMKSQAEADAIKKKQEEENLAKQEAMLSTQAKFNTPSPTKQADGTLKANMPNKAATDKKSDANVKAEEQPGSFLVDEQDKVELFNPFHSKADGKFTSGKGGVSGGIVSPNKNKIAEQPKEFNIGGLLVKTALVGGALGAGGLMVSKIISQYKENDELQNRLDLTEKGFTQEDIDKIIEIGYSSVGTVYNPATGESDSVIFLKDGTMMNASKVGAKSVIPNDLRDINPNPDKDMSAEEVFAEITKQMAAENKTNLQDLISQAELDIDNMSDEQVASLSKDMLLDRIKRIENGEISVMSGDYQFQDLPQFKTKQDVDRFLTERYAKLGVNLDTNNIQFQTNEKGLWGNITRDVFGNPNGRVVNINEEYYNMLFGNDEGGKVFTTHALAHEYGHSLQAFGQGDDGNITRPSDESDLYRIEGGAEVYARLALASYKVNAGSDYKEYTTSTGVAAGLIDATTRQNGGNLTSALTSYNTNIASNVQHYNFLKSLFPSRMKNTTSLPSQTTIQKWLEKDYNITTDKSMDDLMQMTLSMNGNN